MNIFYRRPLALFCSIFAAASICGCFLPYKHKVCVLLCSLIAILILTSILAIAKKHRAHLLKYILCILFAALAILIPFLSIDQTAKKLEKHVGKETEITALVTNVGYSAVYTSTYQVKLLSVNGEELSTNAIVTFEYNAMLELGDMITGDFLVSTIDEYTENPQYYRAKNTTLSLVSTSEEPGTLSISHGHDDITIKLHRLNQRLSSVICQGIDGEAGNLVSALILGNKDLLSAETVRNFRRAGISHVIAISGMHLSVLMFAFDFALKKLHFPKGTRGATVILAAFLYLALTGFALSTVRAFVMSAFVYLAYALSSESDMLTNLLFALFFILAVSPSAVYDIGLWLSCLAVLGIFVADYFINKFSEHLYKKVKPENKYAKKMSPITAKILLWLFSSVLITIAANVFICVPAWLCFNEISTVSVLTNLVASPTVSLILFLAPIFMAVNKISFFADAIGLIIKLTCNLLLKFISFITAFEWTTVSLNYVFAGPIIITLAIALALCLILKMKRKWIIALPPVIASVLFALCLLVHNQYYAQIMTVEYLGSKESEMILINDGDEHVIIDISSGAYSYAYNAYLQAVDNCATEISSYVITHYHNKQLNSLYKLSRSTVIRKLYLPYPQSAEEYHQMSSLISTAIKADVNVELYDSYSPTELSKNVKLMLSSRVFLKRSTHPVFYFTLITPLKALTYSSESIHEHPEYYEMVSTLFEHSDYIILGVHGPITKSEFSYDLSNGEKGIIIANNDIFENFKCDNLSKHSVANNALYAKIEIPKQ